MALEYYDDVIAAKLSRWLPSTANVRVLKPDETKRLFEMHASDTNDKPLQLPLIALSRNNDIELILNVKSPKSYAGKKLTQTKEQSLLLNAIPVKLQYQLDIYTKFATEGDEYLRQFLFKLINNPSIKIMIPYNGINIEQIANIRILNNVSDTSAISERLFSGQFTRWTIQFEILDAFLYDAPYKKNWQLLVPETNDDFLEWIRVDEASKLVITNQLDENETIESVDYLPFKWKK